MSRLLRYRAGPAALERLRRSGFDPADVTTFIAPASGPKWLVLVGIDRAIIASGPLGAGPRPCLLAGASAGAWRTLAMASETPEITHRALERADVEMVFPPGVSPPRITSAYRSMLEDLFPPHRRSAIVASNPLQPAVHVARARGAAGSRRRPLQAAALAAAAAANAVTSRAMHLLFERTLFLPRPETFEAPFNGTVLPLTAVNLVEVALASGSVPLYFTPVTTIPEAPPGAYLDGGMMEYHLNQAYDPTGITLFPHFQRRMVPNWFDRWIRRRRPRAVATHNLLQIHPSDGFIASLPGGRIPTRDDFKIFQREPEERIRRWNTVVEASRHLGDEFFEDVRRGRISDLVEPL